MKNPLLAAIYNIFGNKSLHTEETKIAICIYFARLYTLTNDDHNEVSHEIQLQFFESYLFPNPVLTNLIYKNLINSQIQEAAKNLQKLLTTGQTHEFQTKPEKYKLYGFKKTTFH